MNLINLNHVSSKTLETERLILKKFEKADSEIDKYNWIITEKHSGNITGEIAFFDSDDKTRSCAIGYHTEIDYRNKGYMTEALSCALRFMIIEAGYNRISGGHQADNPASGRVMKKAGMKLEGRLRQDFMNEDGTLVDSILYSMTKQDLEQSSGVRNLNKKLIIISGSPCVGKTTVADELFGLYDNSAHCDGDGLWRVNTSKDYDSRLRNGDKNMSFVLANYLNSDFEYVIFSSVVSTYESIREPILKDIAAFTANDYTTIGFTLTCSEKTLTERYNKRGDDWGLSFHWLHLDPYPNDYVINTDDKTVAQVVDEIRSIIDAK